VLEGVGIGASSAAVLSGKVIAGALV
jgi:hypothetical protein